jgi:hypothetical protein
LIFVSAHDAISTAMQRLLSSILFISILLLTPRTASSINPRATLDQLKHLDITCYVPTWLPKGFKEKIIRLTYEQWGPNEGGPGRFPLYSIEYGNDDGGTFTVESAREGIRDRKIMETSDSADAQVNSPLGPLYLTYTPRGKGKTDRKVEIKANWVADANMKAEKAKGLAHPILGRYHGFSATAISVSDFEKIVASLKPIPP